jgi:hypothetical protein
MDRQKNRRSFRLGPQLLYGVRTAVKSLPKETYYEGTRTWKIFPGKILLHALVWRGRLAFPVGAQQKNST